MQGLQQHEQAVDTRRNRIIRNDLQDQIMDCLDDLERNPHEPELEAESIDLDELMQKVYEDEAFYNRVKALVGYEVKMMFDSLMEDEKQGRKEQKQKEEYERAHSVPALM